MTRREAAAYLELPEKTVLRLAQQGRILCIRTDGRIGTRVIAGKRQEFRITGRLHFRVADLDAWRAEHSNNPERSRRIVPTTNPALAALMPKVRVF